MNKAFYSDTPCVQYGETDMSELMRNPCRFGCDVQIVCTDGTAEISTGIQSYTMRTGTELFLLGGSLVQVCGMSRDFRARMLLYPKDVVFKALLPLDASFLNYIHEYPFFDHLRPGALDDEWSDIMQWMDMARMLFGRALPSFRKQIEQNFLQSMLMYLYNRIPHREIVGSREISRKQVLCHQFVRLIRENSAHEHQVPFYADRLCISSRYLGDIVAENFGGLTPKQLIDKQLISEIKVQLDNPLLSVSEIAQYFNFPEHTSMSRFFKRNTGMSPKEYRASRK